MVVLGLVLYIANINSNNDIISNNMRALFKDYSPSRREQAPRLTRKNTMSSQHSSGGGGGSSGSVVSSSGGGAAAARRMRAAARGQVVMQPTEASNRRRNMAFMKYGEETRSETSMHRTREHARQIAMRMSDEASNSPHHHNTNNNLSSFANFAAFSEPHARGGDGDNDSTFQSEASSFFDEDPFGSNDDPAQPPPVKQAVQQRKDDSFVADWPTDFESPKSMSTMPSNSSMQSAYVRNQREVQTAVVATPPNNKHTQRMQQHAYTQPRMLETPEIRPSMSNSSSTGAAARRRMRQQMKHGADLTPPQSPHSVKRYTSGDYSLGSSQKGRLGDHVQNYSNRSRTGSYSNRSVSGKSVESSTSGSDIFDHRSNVGAGFTFDAFGLDPSQIDDQVNEAMQDLAGTHPDFSFFKQNNDDDFANGRWNQQASPAPSRASTPPIAEEGQDEFVDGFRVTKPSSLPVHIRPQYSPSASERSSLTSESNHDDGRVNLFKEKAAFASSRPRMIVRPSGPPQDNNLDVDRRGRVPAMPTLATNQQIEFVGEDSEVSFSHSRTPPQDYQSTEAPRAHSDYGAPSDGGVASDAGVQSGPDSDVAVQSDHGRNVRAVVERSAGLPIEVMSKKKSSTDTATTAETSGTYQLPFEEKKEEESKATECSTTTSPVRNVMAQWQHRNESSLPTPTNAKGGGLSLKTGTIARDSAPPTLTRQSLERYQSRLEQGSESAWPGQKASPHKQTSPLQKLAYRSTGPKSEGGAVLRSSQVNSVMNRIQNNRSNASDAKSDSGGPSPYQIKLRKTGLLSRPSEDNDTEVPLTPLAQKRSPKNEADSSSQDNRFSRALVPGNTSQSEFSRPSSTVRRPESSPHSHAVDPAEEPRPVASNSKVAPAPSAPPKKLSYRERRELELQKQREEERQKEEAQKSPEKDVASLIRKRIAANKKAVSPPGSANKYEAQDTLGSLRPSSAPYSRTSVHTSGDLESNAPLKPSNFREYQQQYHRQSSVDTDTSKDLSIESARADSDVFKKLETQPSAAVSHLRRLQQLQSGNENSDDTSPEARHQMLVTVGSGDAEDHRKSTTPKATKMMLNAFLAGRSSIGDGNEVSSTVQSEDKASNAGNANGLPALKDDPKYEKYFKMLKLGMPKEVVKHAMVRDGEDPSIMDQDPNKPAGIPLKDDPTYQKYFKMLRVGMPMEAVKHAMIRDGLDCSVMDQDHNLPVRKMTKKEDDDEPKEKDSRRRARLHWKTLRKVTSNSLWAKIDQEVDMEQIEIDEQEFQELFQAEQDEVKPAKTVAATPAKGVTVRVIDPKRANNGGIILARLKMSHDDMADAVDRINEYALNPEQIENIIEYLPTKEERKALESYMLEGGQDAAEKFEGLCECEKFMVSMMTVKHAKRKVRALLFKLQFEKCLDDILKDTLAVEAACDNLTHSVRLRQLLGIILNFGNRLNTAGNKRRKAGAFTLDSLLKLNQAKAFDRKTTFLNYIILIVQRNNEILLNFKDDLPAVFKADKVFWDQCLSDLEEVESQLENVRKIALYQAKQAHYRFRRRKRQDDDGDESLGEDDMNMSLEEEVEALRSTPIGMFTLSAIKYVSSLRDKVEETKSKFARLLEYFGEEDKNLQPHELFTIIVTFCRDFEKAKEEVFAHEKKKQREERKRQAGRPPTHSPAAPIEKKRQPMLKASSHQPNFSDAMKGNSRQESRTTGQHSSIDYQADKPAIISPPRPSTKEPSNPLNERSNTAIPQSNYRHQVSYSSHSMPPHHTNQTGPSASRSSAESYAQPGATSAAARLKAKARIQRRTSPVPPEDQRVNILQDASKRASVYEANDCPAEYSSSNYTPSTMRYSSTPAPPAPRANTYADQSNPARSPRSSFRHKRRMEVRERIRQANGC